jgi:undecaprenyl-diphosphatase
MEGSKGVTKGETQRIQPLVLSRRSIIIIVIVAIVLWGIALFLWGQVKLDKWLLISQNDLRTNELVVGVAQAASRYGMAVVVLVYLVYLLVAFKNEKLRKAYRVYLLVILMFGIAGIGGDVLQALINRPRPFVEYAGQLITFSNAASPSFPSGHATKSIALALPFLILVATKDNWHRAVKILLAVVVLGVCWSRVLLGAHFVSDVLAGVGMALICFPLATFINNKILGKLTNERLNFVVKIWGLILFGLMIYLVFA